MEKELYPILKRMIEVSGAKGLSNVSFTDKLGMSYNTYMTMLKRNSEPSSSMCAKVLEVFDDISAEWLMTGNGSMYKTDSISGSNVNTGNVTGDLTQTINQASDLTKEIAKIKMMLRGCSSVEDLEIIKEEIEKHGL